MSTESFLYCRNVAVVFLVLAVAPAAVLSAGEELPSLIAKRDLSVLQSPRRGLFCQHGDELGKLARGTDVSQYESITSYCGLGYKIEYLKFEFKTTDGRVLTAYVRRKENNGSDRFDVKSK